jgi:hypothetical protein
MYLRIDFANNCKLVQPLCHRVDTSSDSVSNSVGYAFINFEDVSFQSFYADISAYANYDTAY